jgi:pyruvate/2-oxoglutarate dehydrogenase complex dihydrolipoamide acyltransferase (E2) component
LVSPIFVRPVREQLEHDRLIRFLQAKYKRKFEAAINPGEERTTPVKIGLGTFYPDVVLTSGKKLAGLVEVETGESVNNLEAMAQWVHFSRAKVPFHLYVPVPGYDAARRLCQANDAKPSEIWTYRGTSDGFDLVRIFHDPSAAAPVKTAAKPSPAAARPAKAPAKPPKAAAPAKPAKPAKPAAAKPAKPAKKAPAKPAAAKPASKNGKRKR